MPKSKEDVSEEIKENKVEWDKIKESLEAIDAKETKGRSGKLSGLGESNRKNK